MTANTKRDYTACVHHPETPLDGFKSLAVPTYRASTIVFDDSHSYRTRGLRAPDGYAYGLTGTPTSRTLESQLSILHGGERSIIVPSGLAAITAVMLTVLTSGNEVLIPDNVYPPVKHVCRDVLARFGIRSQIYDPLDLNTLEASITPQTRLIWIETPGSTTMEVSDVGAVTAIARQSGILTGCDNTWASPLLFKPLHHGVDVVAEAITKYIGGHSDILLGSITFKDTAVYTAVRKHLAMLGIAVSPDDCSLALRGLETLAIRMDRVEAVARTVAERLVGAPCVDAVLHPALPDAPGNAYWRRAFTGSSGVFSLRLALCSDAALDAALSQLKVFRMGASWGGTRSLIAPMRADRLFGPASVHEATYLRVSIGLEDADELWTDLFNLLRHLAKLV